MNPQVEVIGVIVCLTSFFILLLLQVTGYINWPFMTLTSPLWMPFVWALIVVGLAEIESKNRKR